MRTKKKISVNNFPIKKIDLENIQDHNFWDLFSDGTKAMQLTGDHRIQSLWSKLFESDNSEIFRSFWKNDLATFSKDHIRSSYNLGDMIRYFPNSYGHTARKLHLDLDKTTGKIKVTPESFQTGTNPDFLEQSTLREAWDLASDIFKLCLPKEVKCPEYKVSLEILKYPKSYKEFRQIFELLEDSYTGKWMKFGKDLDLRRNKILVSSPFDLPIISKFYGHLSMLPFVNELLVLLNRFIFRSYSYNSEDLEILGPPHVDGSRAFTMLLGDRESMVTEVYHNRQWHELKLSSTSIHIFPGKLWNKNLGLKPTYHRYSIKKNEDSDKVKESLNVTLLLGIIEL